MSEQGIESLVISPDTELQRPADRELSGAQEEEFFSRGAEEYKLRHNEQNLGFVGKFFGSGKAASTNIAGICLGLCFLFIGILLFFPAPESDSHIKSLFGIVGLILGYLFGTATSNK